MLNCAPIEIVPDKGRGGEGILRDPALEGIKVSKVLSVPADVKTREFLGNVQDLPAFHSGIDRVEDQAGKLRGRSLGAFIQ